MRLTKRQLKRIIREEYSRLKRNGLIQEMAPMMGGSMAGEIDDYCDAIMDVMIDLDEVSYPELRDELMGMPGFDEALLGNAIDTCMQRGMITARFLPGEGIAMFSVNPDYAM